MAKKYGKKELRNKEADVLASEPITWKDQLNKDGSNKPLDPIWNFGAGDVSHPPPNKAFGDRLSDAVKAAHYSPKGYDLNQPGEVERALRETVGQDTATYYAGGQQPPKRPDINLIDMLLHNKPAQPEFGYDPPRLKLLQAQRFMMDAPASIFMGHVTMDWGRQALMAHELTRAPYELTWLEFDSIAYSSVVPTTQGADPDLKVGYLYDHGDVYIASTSGDEAMWMPYRIRLNTPVSFEEEQENAEFFRLSRLTYRMFLMGTLGEAGQVPIDKHFWDSAEVAHLCRSHKFEIEPLFKHYIELNPRMANEHARHQLVASSAGIMKQVILAFILLTRPNKHVYFGEAAEPAKRVWLKNRQVPMVSHTKLTMHLKQKDAVRRIGHEITGRHVKHHDVKGHWCESRKIGRACYLQHGTHDWVMLDKDRGECGRGCGAKIWWRVKHEAGDIRLGSTVKTYEVTE